MTDVIILLVLAVILGGAVFFIRRERKAGRKCIGCPHAKGCSGCNQK